MKIGLDWGGTKLEAIALDPVTNEELTRNRIDSPKDDYQDILNAVHNLILETADNNKEITVGIGMPGSLHPKTGLVQVSNTKVLEGQNVKKDLEEKLGFEIKIANDADCLALSEAIDGAGKEFNSVFAVILGTGVGAGYVVNQQLVVGPNKLTGEWGQNPIPGPMDDYEKSIKRHCGRIVVTASVNNVSFGKPIPRGSVVTLEAKVSRAFKSSMEVFVDVWMENSTNEREKCNEAIYTFVAVDQLGHPIEVPAIKPESELEKNRYEGALRRRQLSLILGGRMKAEEATELKALFS